MNEMTVILNRFSDPYFNLAAEEYLLSHEIRDVFMLWRNDRTVVVGKNQNTWAQVNVSFAEENSISVVRRLTGGGAVFHDLGNVNFTFITDYSGEGIDFARFAAPIIRYLEVCGVSACLSGRNDILCDGKKISGNAQCVFERCDGDESKTKRLMHHGTLLYSADLSHMSGVLNVNRQKLTEKGIDSVRSRVANIRELSDSFSSVDAEGFMMSMLRFAEAEYGVTAREFSEAEVAEINELRQSKYSTWEWNFGKSPLFENERTVRFDFGTLTVMYSARHGVIENVAFYGDFFGKGDASLLGETLRGCRLDRDSISRRLSEINIGDYISGASCEDICRLIFD